MTSDIESSIVNVLKELQEKLLEYDRAINEVINKIEKYKEQLKSEYATLQEKKSQKLKQIYEIINPG